jgi:hypothetical protein
VTPSNLGEIGIGVRVHWAERHRADDIRTGSLDQGLAGCGVSRWLFRKVTEFGLRSLPQRHSLTEQARCRGSRGDKRTGRAATSPAEHEAHVLRRMTDKGPHCCCQFRRSRLVWRLCQPELSRGLGGVGGPTRGNCNDGPPPMKGILSIRLAF